MAFSWGSSIRLAFVLANLNDFLKLTVCLIISLELMQRDMGGSSLWNYCSTRFRDDFAAVSKRKDIGSQANIVVNL